MKTNVELAIGIKEVLTEVNQNGQMDNGRKK